MQFGFRRLLIDREVFMPIQVRFASVAFLALALFQEPALAQGLKAKRRPPPSTQTSDTAVLPASKEDTSSRIAAKPVAAPESTTEEKKPVPPKDAAPLDPALQEIMRLRQSMGSVLKGTILEKGRLFGEGANAVPEVSEDELFAESLKRLSAEPPTVFPPAGIPTTPLAPLDILPPKASAYKQPRATPAEQPDVSLVGSLRNASRALDAKANDLEEQRQYEEAERLRELSRQLRQEARRFDQPNPPTVR
jgi:hypothetical protein